MSVRNISRLLLTHIYGSRISYVRRFSCYKTIKTLPNSPKYFCFAFMNLFYVVKAAEMDQKALQAAIAQADEHFSVGRFQDSLNVLEPYKDSEDVEILWRISRALYNKSLQKGIKSAENASLINEAYEYIDKALKLDSKHYAVHKWMAILYDAKSALDGMKARIKALPVFKEHLLMAIQLNPKDATSIHMLGQYMYSIADMSWLQRNIAKALFGNPPEATFEEAFYYFNKAEEVDPNFYSANLLMLGKTCLKLQKIEAGSFWLKCAAAYPVRTDQDEAVRLEAEELLKKHSGVRKPLQGEEKNKCNIK